MGLALDLGYLAWGGYPAGLCTEQGFKPVGAYFTVFGAQYLATQGPDPWPWVASPGLCTEQGFKPVGAYFTVFGVPHLGHPWPGTLPRWVCTQAWACPAFKPVGAYFTVFGALDLDPYPWIWTLGWPRWGMYPGQASSP